MPTAFKVYPDTPLLVTRLMGHVTSEEFREVYAQLRKAPDFSPIFPEIADFRHATSFGFGHQEMARLATIVTEQHWDREIKTAIVADGDLGFGMARIYQNYAQIGQVETVVLFEHPEEAVDWLNLPPESVDLLEFEAA